jgi:CRP-like cAMP-binding protein
MLNPFKKSYTPKELNLLRFLSRIKLFERLNYEELSLITPYLYLREYKYDEAVFFRGDPSNALYIIKSGRIGLNVDIVDRLENLQVIKSGTAFGENSILENSVRIYNAIVESETADIYVIPKINIQEIFKDNTRIQAKMMYSLAESFNEIYANLFKTYRTSKGFFNLAQIFSNG